jgi:small-conductance mechanosensitive channel
VIKMSIANWIFIIFIIIFLILLVIGISFPKGKSDWPLSSRSTIYLIVAALFFVLLIILLNIVFQYVELSGFITLSIYFSIILFSLLIVISFFYPNGLQTWIRK